MRRTLTQLNRDTKQLFKELVECGADPNIIHMNYDNNLKMKLWFNQDDFIKLVKENKEAFEGRQIASAVINDEKYTAITHSVDLGFLIVETTVIGSDTSKQLLITVNKILERSESVEKAD